MSQYPNLDRVIREMATNNCCGPMRHYDTWVYPDNAAALESAIVSAALTDDELLTLTCPCDDSDVQLATARPELMPVVEFLNEAFDGALTQNFFVIH